MGSRLRVHLDSSLKPGAPEYEGCHKFWWQPGPSADGGCLRDILQQLAECVQLPVAAGELQTELDGFVVPLNSDASLLRDGDVLRVSHNPRKRKQGAAAPRPAAQTKRAKAAPPAPAPAAAARQQAAVASGSSDSSDSSSSEEEEEEESSEQGAKSERFFTPGDKLGSPACAGTPAEGGTAKKQPSRSARRKAAKRRLRRLGIAPSAATPGSQGRPDPALAAAAAADPFNPNLPVCSAGRAANGFARKQAPPPAAKRQQAAAAPKAAAKPKPKPAETSSEESSSSSEEDSSSEEESSSSEEGESSSEEESSSDEEEAGPAVARQQQQQQQQQHQSQRQRQPAAAPLEGFAQLPALAGRPSIGDVLAYKLLEIGPSFEPHVSEARAGTVTGLAGTQVTLEPYPDPDLHPLAAQRAERRAQRQAEAREWGQEEAEEEEEGEGVPSQYDESGVLAADLSSFVELRLLRRAPGAAHLAGAATSVAAEAAAPAAQGEATEDLGPKCFSQLGPPRPAARGPAAGGAVISPEGGWAALHAQLQQRRAQLSGGKGARPRPALASASPNGATPAPEPAAARGGQPRGAMSDGKSSGKKSTPGAQVAGGGRNIGAGAVKPRGGVRRSALGPMLRILRSNSQFEEQEEEEGGEQD